MDGEMLTVAASLLLAAPISDSFRTPSLIPHTCSSVSFPHPVSHRIHSWSLYLSNLDSASFDSSHTSSTSLLPPGSTHARFNLQFFQVTPWDSSTTCDLYGVAAPFLDVHGLDLPSSRPAMSFDIPYTALLPALIFATPPPVLPVPPARPLSLPCPSPLCHDCHMHR